VLTLPLIVPITLARFALRGQRRQLTGPEVEAKLSNALV
jgi:hypothetical protein